MQFSKEELFHHAMTFLKEQHLGVIATVSADNTPEAANVMYLLDSMTLYILSHSTSRKVANIHTNPHVAFVVGTTLVAHTAQIQGTAEIIESANPEYKVTTEKFQKNNILNKNPLLGAYKSDYVVIKISISWLRWLVFDQLTNKEVYTVLIP